MHDRLHVPTIALLAAVLALVATACGSDAGADDQVSVETAAVTVTGDPLPRLGTIASDAGLAAPAFSAQTTHSTEVTSVDPTDGTVRLIGFFAHWCPHCQREVPRVVDFIENTGVPDGVEFVAVSTGVDEGAPNYPPSKWFDDENWPSEVFVDSAASEIALAYGLTGFPFWVAVDGSGSVIERSSGELTEAALAALVARAAAAV